MIYEPVKMNPPRVCRCVSPYNFTIIYTGLGDKDQAFAGWQKLSRSARSSSLTSKSLAFRPAPLSPRYAELLRKMNLAP